MAGNPVDSVTISIYPATAIFSAQYVDSLAVDGIDVTFTNSDCTIVSDHLVYNTYTSMSGANTLTITAYGHQYNISPINTDIIVNLPSQNLYAWTTTSSIGMPKTIYTTNTDASFLSGLYDGTNLVFNANGEDITESTFLYGGTAHFEQGNAEIITWVTYDPT